MAYHSFCHLHDTSELPRYKERKANMPYTVTYDPDSSFIVTIFKGKLRLKELFAEEEESIALAIENDTRKFLVDLVDYERSISLTDIYDFPDRYEEKLRRPIYIALVQPLSQEARKDVIFYETVCKNRGWNIMIFARKEDAVAWLKRMS